MQCHARCSTRSLAVGMAVLLALVVLFVSVSGSSMARERFESNEAIPFSSEYYADAASRFGAALSPSARIIVGGESRPATISDYDVLGLHIGWYSDWRTSATPLTPHGMRYAQIILVRESDYPTNTLELTSTVASAPKGSLWIIGNEPERLTQKALGVVQGSRTPEQYAEIYHDVYNIIKGQDAGSWVAIGGIVQPTPLRLQWLERTLAAYHDRYGSEMPVDVWNIHMQILPEKTGSWGAEIPVGIDATQGEMFNFSLETGFYDNANPVLFRQLVISFREWMKAHGFQNKPLIISEYGVLFPSSYIGYGAGYGDPNFGDMVLISFIRETFEFMVDARDPSVGYAADDYHLVQQWLWYSINDQPYDFATGKGYNGSLFSHVDPTQMTIFGVAWREYMHTLLGYPRALLPLVARRFSRP